jgi:proline iminopeptidase
MPVFAAMLALSASVGAGVAAAELFPPVEPFDSGHLAVDDLHEIYYERSGNPEGTPVMVLHGGPGVGSYPLLRRYFDPERYHIVLHDQRGSGRSRPFGELEGNTTADLVADIERLRDHLNLDKLVLFGGSWGSTLALAYAETYPDNVSAMILRGVFLGTAAEIDHHYHESGASLFFPEEFAALLRALPEPDRRPIPNYVYEIARGEDAELRNRVLRALGRFELKMVALEMPDSVVDRIEDQLVSAEGRGAYLIDLHYASNRYFLDEGQLLRDADKLADIPTIIINGRYDLICPPDSAYRLHRALPRSQLILIEGAGHSEREEGTTAALLAAAADLD